MRRHEAYRPFLIDHLLTITIRHWDPAMRLLGAQSLRAICELELPALGPKAAERAVSMVIMLKLSNLTYAHQSLFAMGPDTSDIHGSLLALTEISSAYREAERSFELECRKVCTHFNVSLHELTSLDLCIPVASPAQHHRISET